MTSDHPYALLAKVAWEAVSAGDVEAFAAVCRPDLVWHVAGRGSFSGTYRGLPAVIDYLASVGEDADRFDLTLEDILVGGEFASILFQASGLRGDRRLETGYILLLRIEEARLAEVWTVPRDQHAVDEFWA